jgi:hypothetical protein
MGAMLLRTCRFKGLARLKSSVHLMVADLASCRAEQLMPDVYLMMHEEMVPSISKVMDSDESLSHQVCPSTW